MKEVSFGNNRRAISLHVSLSPYKLRPGDLDKLEEAVRGAKPLRSAILAELKRMYPEVESQDSESKPLSDEEQDKRLSNILERIWSGEDDEDKPR